MASAWIGAAMIGLALFAGLLDAHVRRRKAWDRPRFTLSTIYRRLFRPAHLLLLASGWIVLARAWWPGALVVAVVLGGLEALRRRARSPAVIARAIESRARAIAASGRAVTPREATVSAILERHPEWGAELAERIVEDAGDAGSLGRIVARMERGWPGE